MASGTDGNGEAKPKRKRMRWTMQMKAAFLDHLAATCNIKASAAAIGVHSILVYSLRRRDAEFAAMWDDALVLGYQVLETQLVGHALAGGGKTLENGATELTGPIDVELALKLLDAHRAGRTGRRAGPKPQRARQEETDKAILRKLAALEARRKAGA